MLFPCGNMVITPTALHTLNAEDVTASMTRHLRGDWGDLCEGDRKANNNALRSMERLFSVYHDSNRTKFYIITEADRSVTTVLLPEDY